MLFLYVLLSISLLGWILYPVLVNTQKRSGDPLLQERIQAAEAALEQLYAQGRQNISEEDFPKIERHLLVSLARLLKRAGLPPRQTTAVAEEPANDGGSDAPRAAKTAEVTEIASQEAPQAAQASFCSSCGHPNTGDFAYCPACGNRLSAA